MPTYPVSVFPAFPPPCTWKSVVRILASASGYLSTYASKSTPHTPRPSTRPFGANYVIMGLWFGGGQVGPGRVRVSVAGVITAGNARTAGAAGRRHQDRGARAGGSAQEPRAGGNDEGGGGRGLLEEEEEQERRRSDEC